MLHAKTIIRYCTTLPFTTLYTATARDVADTLLLPVSALAYFACVAGNDVTANASASIVTALHAVRAQVDTHTQSSLLGKVIGIPTGKLLIQDTCTPMYEHHPRTSSHTYTHTHIQARMQLTGAQLSQLIPSCQTQYLQA
jgi:hypothetical protein